METACLGKGATFPEPCFPFVLCRVILTKQVRNEVQCLSGASHEKKMQNQSRLPLLALTLTSTLCLTLEPRGQEKQSSAEAPPWPSGAGGTAGNYDAGGKARDLQRWWKAGLSLPPVHGMNCRSPLYSAALASPPQNRHKNFFSHISTIWGQRYSRGPGVPEAIPEQPEGALV